MLGKLFREFPPVNDEQLTLALKVYKSIVKDALGGDAVECPFCHNTFAKLLPFGFKYPVLSRLQIVGGGYRPNVLCPECFSSDRERLVLLYLKAEADVGRKQLKVLHVAPEDCLMAYLSSASQIQYVSVDLQPGIAMMTADMTKTAFPDAEYDLIVCNHVLEHIPNDRAAMREILRILKPSGCAVLQVPISVTLLTTYENPAIDTPEKRATEFGQSDHVRIYGQDYVRRLEESGFSVRIYDPVSCLGAERLRRHGCSLEEKIYVAQRRLSP